MASIVRVLITYVAMSLMAAVGVVAGEADLMRPLGPPDRYTFFPNQLAANEWYKPAGQVVNGHIAESFGNERNWADIRRFLERTHGAFGVNAAEIGYLDSEWLLGLRRDGVRLTAEAPAWTQCLPGRELARTEVFGSPSAGKNILEFFDIQDKNGRSNATGHGWFFTKDGKDYVPDEITLDHRLLMLLPRFNNDALLKAIPNLNWQARKDASRVDPCPSADTFHNPRVDRLTGNLEDYVDYAKTLVEKYPTPPAFSFAWNVNPEWEWGDERCLDELHKAYPDPAAFERAFRDVAKPCHRDTAILERLIEKLCQAGSCPSAVYMDMDLYYKTSYSLDVLRRNKAALQKQGVPFGVLLADECNERVLCVQSITAPAEMRLIDERGDDVKLENMLDRKSLINKFNFLIENGIIDKDTKVRFESWNVRPFEKGDQVSEDREGSFANTTRYLMRQLGVRGWAPDISK